MNIKNLIKFCTFITIAFFTILKLGEVFIPESILAKQQGNIYTIKGYYKLPKNSIDVLFLGDSSIQRAISPMEMWHNAGIASFNYSVTSLRTYGAYYLLKEALKTENPKLVVIDPATMFYHYAGNEALDRVPIDYLNNSKNKFNMINDDNYKMTFEDKVSLFFPIFRYHSRWQDITADSIQKLTKDYSSITRGFVMSYAINPNVNRDSYMKNYNNKVKFENNQDEYLKKIIDLCNSKNIKLMILSIPDTASWGKRQSELITKFANEKEVDILDLNVVSDLNLDWNTDTKDKGNHVNILGALKITDYVSKYIKNNYDIPDHRGDKNYSDWDDNFEKYKTIRDEYINKANLIKEKISQSKDINNQ